MLVVFLFLLASCTPTLRESRCGHERWDVKILSDPDTSFLALAPVSSSIAALSKPNRVSVGVHEPRLPFEKIIVAVSCKISAMKREADGDIHLVLEDRSGRTMIGEIPNPEKCEEVAQSRHALEYSAAIEWCRENLDEPKTNFHYFNRRAIVTGVLFQDSTHGQFGEAANAREIHPILRIESSRNHNLSDTVTLGTQ